MTRLEFEDRICAVRRELEFLQAVKVGCEACYSFSEGKCKLYGPIPEEFVAVGCDQWEFFDTPF